MRVGVVGAGRVGVVTGLVLFELGHEVTLFDIDRSRVASLAAGTMPFFEAGADDTLQQATGTDRWLVSDRAADLIGCDAVLITVPTPAGPDGAYELDAVRDAATTLAALAADTAGRPRWRGVFLRSTVLPGTTEAVLGDALARGGGAPCPVGYLPEFLREGSAMADARRPDRIVVGAADVDLSALARALFDDTGGVFLDTGIRTAELIKTANNALLSLCVSFANEIARIAAITDGADALDVFAGIHLDRRFQGESRAPIVDYLLPGPGFGGSCLGKDLAALAAFARARHDEPLLLDAALRINQTQPAWFVDRIDAAIDGLAGRRVLVLGLAFKPDTDDSRESVALPILRQLAARGARVQVHDPRAIATTDPATLAAAGAVCVADSGLHAALDGADAVVLVTPWRDYLELLPAVLAERSRPLLFADARGSLRNVRRAPSVTYLNAGGRGAE